MPARAAPPLNALAERLLGWEARQENGRASGSPVAESSAAFGVCEKLRPQLARLMGVVGFRALFSRALVLALPQAPWLTALEINADGSLTGLERVSAGLSRAELSRGEVALVSQLLGLLETFIGRTLTVGLIQDAWPDRDLSDFEAPT